LHVSFLNKTFKALTTFVITSLKRDPRLPHQPGVGNWARCMARSLYSVTMVATTDPARRVPDSPTASAATNICLSLTTVKPTPKQPEALYITHPEHENYASRVIVCQFLPTRK